MNTILFALWFFLPAGIANMMPVFAAKMPVLRKWNNPLDFGVSISGKRIFGDHKTIRGFVVGIISGILIAVAQNALYQHSLWVQSFVLFDYMKGIPILFGILLSFGALAGDSVKSFFKRRVGVASGKTWFPFDQVDYILGGIIASLVLVQVGNEIYFTILLVWFGLHLLSTTIGFLLGLKESAI